jgi:hypothetical protein
MTRRTATLIACVYAAVLTFATVLTASAKGVTPSRIIGHGQIKFNGAGPELWAARWRRQRRLTIALRRELAARVDRVVWLVSAFQCVHSYEGAWTANTGNGYRGGLQFGAAEWKRYGGQFAPRADLATPAEQITAGIAYHAVAGFHPWPLTARRCGLIR